MDLMAMQSDKNLRNLKMTILHRPGGKWHQAETERLVNGLFAEVTKHPKHPEYLVLSGHFTKIETLKAIGGGAAYTATQIIGVNDGRLPFRPGFI